MNIAVYLGSSFGDDPVYKDSVEALGKWIGTQGHTLVYGGNSRGLMGILAESVHQNGGRLIGVEPEFLMEWGTPYPYLDELITTETMTVRKQKMYELADHYIACPGGIGTLDEITEIMVLRELNQITGTVILYNVNGFYEPLRALLEEEEKHGFVRHTLKEHVFFAETAEEIAALLEESAL